MFDHQYMGIVCECGLTNRTRTNRNCEPIGKREIQLIRHAPGAIPLIKT